MVGGAMSNVCGNWRRSVCGVDHAKAGSGFSFVQISDSHIGFNKAANQDVTGTLKLALDKINALPAPPELLLHTGDISHSSKPAEFDTAQQLINGVKVGEAFYVPGEHDIATDDGAMYHERFGKEFTGAGVGIASRIKTCTSSGSTIVSKSTRWAKWATINSRVEVRLGFRSQRRHQS